MLNPNLVFLVGTEFSRSTVDHPAIVVIDFVQDNLLIHATHQTFPIEKIGRPLPGTDPDNLLVGLCEAVSNLGVAELPIRVASCLLGIGL